MKKIFSFILVISIFLSMAAGLDFTANAAAPVTGYTYKLSVKTTDDADGWNSAHFDLSNVGLQLPMQSWDIKSYIDDSDEEWSTTFYSDVFYNEATIYVDFGGISIPDWTGRVTVEINGTRMTYATVKASADLFETVRKTVAFHYENPFPQTAIIYTKDANNNKKPDFNFVQSKTANKGECSGFLYANIIDQYNAYWKTRYGTMALTNTSNSDSVSLIAESDTEYCWKVISDTGSDHSTQMKLHAQGAETYADIQTSVDLEFEADFAFWHDAQLTDSSGEHGKTVLSEKKVYTGDTVTINTTPDEGYKLESLTVTDADNNNISVTDNSFIMPNSDVTVSAVYTPITYTARFVADGKIFAEVPYTVETTSITEPDVPIKDGYNGAWQPYELAIGGVTVEAVYDAIIHNYIVSASTPATCTEAGYDTYTCTYCGESYNMTTTPAKGHQFAVRGYTAPTCTENGYQSYQCINCSETYSGDYVPAKGHSFVADVVAPTCTEEGYTTYTCEVCGEARTKADGSVYKTNITKPAAHSYKVTASTPATCTTEGYDTYTCEVCGDTYSKTTTPALTHEWRIDKWTNDETDHWHVCTRCDEVLDKEAHIYGEVSYEWDGKTSVTASHTCTVCGYVESEKVDTTFEKTKDPTCTVKGENTYTATFANPAFEVQTKTFDDIPALGHDWKPEWSKNGTHHWHDCTRCNAVNKKAVHTYGTKGASRYTCSVCGYLDKAKKAAAEKADKELAYSNFVAGLKGTSDSSKVTLKWGKVKDADRYVIYAVYCGDYNKYKQIGTINGSATTYNIKKLDGKKIKTSQCVKAYVVAQKKVDGKYKTIFESPKIHIAGAKSAYTNAKSVKVEKGTFTLGIHKTANIKSSLVLVNKNKKMIDHVAKFRYFSGNTAVVTVDKNGKIKTIGKGTAYVYVYANNGFAKAIKVIVK